MTTYPACLGCTNLMRGSNQLAKDHPGTVRPGGYGYCLVCRTKQKRAEPIPLVVEERHFDLNQARTALNGWTTERNRRLGVVA